MSLYIVSISAVSTLVLSSVLFWYDPSTVTRKYFLLTWISGSLWTLIIYHSFYYFQHKRRKREEEKQRASNSGCSTTQGP